MPKSRLTPWKRIKRDTIVDDYWLKIHRDVYDLPNGKKNHEYYVLEERGGVNVVAITPDNKVLLVRQYRPAVDDIVHDFPGGMVEGDAPLLDQAKRELLEETGYASSKWYELGKAHALPNRANKCNHFFLALDVTKKQAQQLDDTEEVDFELVSAKKVKELILSGEFACGICMSSLLKSMLKLEELGRKF